MWRIVIVPIAAVPLFAPAPSGGGTAGRELAFARAGNIWTIGADGTRARLLLRGAYSPAWSPDGSRLAFVSSRSGDEEIYEPRPAGRDLGLRKLTQGVDPDWNPRPGPARQSTRPSPAG